MTAILALADDLIARPQLPPQTNLLYSPYEASFVTGITDGSGQPLTQTTPSPHNPWLDYRLDVFFTAPDGVTTYQVPGFYGGNGAFGTSGSVWKARFAPFGQSGGWTYQAFLRHGAGVNADAAQPLTGTLVYSSTVLSLPTSPPSVLEPGFLKHGRLRAVGEHYLRFDDGTYFIKTGVGGPENFLAYKYFTGWSGWATPGVPLLNCTVNNETVYGGPSIVGGHEYTLHEPDWIPGGIDPSWTVGGMQRGQGIIGALNYLSGRGMNSLYLLLMNLGGDGRDVFPFVEKGPQQCPPAMGVWDAVYFYSVPRMREWNIVFEHAMRKGILLNMFLAEEEWSNIAWLGGSAATNGNAMHAARRLFLKQMIAMFAHNPAIKWNLCEENNADPTAGRVGFNIQELQSIAGWIESWDVYDHPLSVHSNANTLNQYEQMLTGQVADWLDATSLQVHGEPAPCGTGTFQTRSTYYSRMCQEARNLFWNQGQGRKVVVDMDENGSGCKGAGPDLATEWNGAEDRRKRVLYDVLFSGANLEWYFGYYSDPAVGGDYNLEDFSTRDMLFDYTTKARQLLGARDFVNMSPADQVLQTGCTASPSMDLETTGTANDGDSCDLVFGRPRVFAKFDGSVLIHYPRLSIAGTGTVNLGSVSAPGQLYTGIWFDPRTGGLFGPITRDIGSAALFSPPLPTGPGVDTTLDWVYIMERNQ